MITVDTKEKTVFGSQNFGHSGISGKADFSIGFEKADLQRIGN